MLNHSKDKTIERNMLAHYAKLIEEYTLIKAKHPSSLKFVSDFYKKHNIKRQNFIKIYHKFLNRGIEGILPDKRGPKFKTCRTPEYIENLIICERDKGFSRYEIYQNLKPYLKELTPSPSGIYNVLKRRDMNRLSQPQKRSKRMIIKEKAGELGHIDCYYLPKGMLINDDKRYYVVCVLDDATRLAWAGIVPNLKSIHVMFKSLECINYLKHRYNIEFKEMLSDNGAEFGSGINAKNKDDHPFEIMLNNLGIKHRYTKPYKPQSNGKVERWWRTFREDFVDETVFENMEEMQQTLYEYLLYYNNARPHQSLNGLTPQKFNEKITKASTN